MISPVCSHQNSGCSKMSSPKQSNYKEQKKGIVRKSFTTSAVKLEQRAAEQVERSSLVLPTTLTCLYCKGEHIMETCNKLKGKPHKEKLEFLRSKGLCFSCLKQGHMSKLCKAKESCEVCSLTHHTLLNIKKKDVVVDAEKRKNDSDGHTVLSAFVCAQSEGHELTGAGEDDCTLAIVPVQVKSKFGSEIVRTYAFLDPGSSAKALMNGLKLCG